MKIDAALIWGLSLALCFLPDGLWQGAPMIPLLILFSFPHFVATYVIWGTRLTSWKSEILAMAFPLVFLATCAVLEGQRGWAASLPYLGTYLYLTYHFARQCFGAAWWGSLRLGCHFGRFTRYWLEAWFLVVPAVALYALFSQRPPRTLFYHEVQLQQLPPEAVPSLYVLIGLVLVATCAALMLHYHRTRQRGVLWSFVMLAIPLIWFLPPFQSAEWIPLIPLLHALQYAPFWGRLLWHKPTPWYLKCAHYGVFVLAGWVLFRWWPLRLVGLTGHYWWYGAWIAMLNAHHFWIDGRIWRLRDQRNQALFTS